jgi:hypothetical protein
LEVLGHISNNISQALKVLEPFGGLRVICFGDFLQIGPVLAKNKAPQDWPVLAESEKSGDRFGRMGAHLYQNCKAVWDLTQVYRSTDQALLRLSNAVRKGQMVASDLKCLHDQVIKKDLESGHDWENALIITENNSKREYISRKHTVRTAQNNKKQCIALYAEQG